MSAFEGTFVGCFEDKVKVVDRSLPYVQEIDKELTLERCYALCTSRGFQFMGAEYGNECYCSKHPPIYEKLDDSRCMMPCAGNPGQDCGGIKSMSVYKSPSKPAPPVDSRPLVALVMILKDEAHTILDTLQTVRDHVDRWFILDTGSTDGTQDIVKDYMKKVPGKLFEEPFVDYGATRNRIMDLAKETEDCVFTLMLSADEQVRNAHEMRAFLEDNRHSKGTQHDAYPVVMNSGIDFDSVRIARMEGMWRYVGRVHEYLTSPEKKWTDLYRPTPPVCIYLYIIFCS